MTILWRPGGSVTFFCANILILLRTTSMPLRHVSHTSSQPTSAACNVPYVVWDAERLPQPISNHTANAPYMLVVAMLHKTHILRW